MSLKGARQILTAITLAVFASFLVWWGMSVLSALQTMQDRRYLDCVIIGPYEMDCKQVTLTDPAYIP